MEKGSISGKVNPLTNTEDQLRESEERFKILAEATFEGIAITENGVIVDANQQLADIFKTGLDKLIGKKVFELIPPESKEIVKDRIESKSEDPYEHECIRSDGKIFPVEVRGRSLPYKGEMHRVTVVREVTDRKQAEQAFNERDRNYKELIDGMNETVWIIDFNGELIDVNKRAVEILGYTKEELITIGLPGIDALHREDEIKEMTESMEWDKTQKFETAHKTKSGRVFPVEIYSTLITYKGEDVILSIVRDISERKRIENEIQEKNKNLAILQEIGWQLNSSLDFNTVCQMIIDNSVKLLELDSGAIYIARESNIELVATTPPLPDDFPNEFRLAKISDHSFIQKAIEDKTTIVLEDSNKASLLPEEGAVIKLRELRSLIYSPLLDRNETLGIMILGSKKKVRSFSVSEIDLCKTFSNQVALNLKNALLYENLEGELNKRVKIENELQLHHEHLEELVKDRTKELEDKNAELAKFNELFIGREFRIRELKNQIKDLKSELAKYKENK